MLKRRAQLKRKATMRRAPPERVRVGTIEATIPAGTSKAKRRFMIGALEDHAMQTGNISVADALKIVNRRQREITRYAARRRDGEYMAFVKGLPCAVSSRWPNWPPWVGMITNCEGPIEADHMGDRPIGRKAPDDTCVPMCRKHHRERTDHHGVFFAATKEQLREWRALVIDDTKRLFESRARHS